MDGGSIPPSTTIYLKKAENKFGERISRNY